MDATFTTAPSSVYAWSSATAANDPKVKEANAASAASQVLDDMMFPCLVVIDEHTCVRQLRIDNQRSNRARLSHPLPLRPAVHYWSGGAGRTNHRGAELHCDGVPWPLCRYCDTGATYWHVTSVPASTWQPKRGLSDPIPSEHGVFQRSLQMVRENDK
jgi:hypothetical protein